MIGNDSASGHDNWHEEGGGCGVCRSYQIIDRDTTHRRVGQIFFCVVEDDHGAIAGQFDVNGVIEIEL